MNNMRLLSPFSRFVYRPMMSDLEDFWPSMTMTDGIDMYEEQDKIIVKAPAPDVPQENVDIQFENGVLRIKAHFSQKTEEKDAQRIVYKQERVSSFDYTTTLPRPVDPKSIEATLENGVIVVTATIAEEAKPKKILIKAAKKA